MFSKLKGVVDEISGPFITLDVSGVGYEVFCSGACQSILVLGQVSSLVIFTDVKEDSIRLFGFVDALEKKVFQLLTTTKGIGTRTAMEIISRVDKVDLLKIIGAGDISRLQAVKGIGKKTAERLVVELKDRVAEYALETSSTSRLHVEVSTVAPSGEACQALEALGFAKKDAELAVAKVVAKGNISLTDAAAIVREALSYI